MSATASLPAPLHLRRGHIVGLSVAVAAVVVVALATTWALRANSDTSSAPLQVHPTLQQVVSTINPDQDYVTGIVAMAPAERVAAFGQTPAAPHQTLQQIVSTITPPAPTSQSHVGGQRFVAGVMAMTPEQLVAHRSAPRKPDVLQRIVRARPVVGRARSRRRGKTERVEWGLLGPLAEAERREVLAAAAPPTFRAGRGRVPRGRSRRHAPPDCEGTCRGANRNAARGHCVAPRARPGSVLR